MDASYDVAIVGGGPGGSAAALALARRHGRSVVLLDRGKRGPILGETLAPGGLRFLEYLGVAASFHAAGHRPTREFASAWGDGALAARPMMMMGRGLGYQLDRQRFETDLLDEVERAGVELCRGLAVRRLTREFTSWSLETVSGDELRARVVIDATGRAAFVARQLGARDIVCDPLIALAYYFETSPCSRPQPNGTVVETSPDGWWHLAPLPAGPSGEARMIATFMTDAERVRALGANQTSGYAAALERTRHVRGLLGGWDGVEGPIVRHAGSSCLDRAGGPGWLAVGDAACGHDPLTSMGISHALASACHAALAVNELLEGRASLVYEYVEALRRNMAGYLDRLRAYYALERRWSDSPFWSTRRSLLELERARARQSIESEGTSG